MHNGGGTLWRELDAWGSRHENASSRNRVPLHLLVMLRPAFTTGLLTFSTTSTSFLRCIPHSRLISGAKR